MYYVNDKKSAIREIQRFLLKISQKNNVPHLSVDGFYSGETEEAVRAFQRLYELDATGKVERETFDAIYSEYVRILNEETSEALELESESYPLKLGDSGNNVDVLNATIRELSLVYNDLPIPYGDFYSPDTADAVRLLQRYFREYESGEVSFAFFNKMKKETTLNQKN